METRDAMNTSSGRLNKEIFSVGIEGLKLPDLIAAFLDDDIELVLDIRRRPSRQSPRLPAKTLAVACAEASIYYIHRPELGTSREFVHHSSTDAKLDVRKYRTYLRRHTETLESVGDAARRHRTCVIGCTADPRRAHRRIFLQEVARLTGLRVVHLRPQHALQVV